ncbi:hypothetical protein GCM10010533_25150 [Mycolicibacterium pallens]
MVCGDVEAVAHVQPMRGRAVRADAGIQVNRFAIQPLRLDDDPPHQGVGMSATACPGDLNNVCHEA